MCCGLIGNRHYDQVAQHSEDAPPRTSKLFRPYLDADDDSPKQTGEEEVIRRSVEEGETDEGSPRVTSQSHPTTRRYGCDLCGKMFSRSNTLVTHRVCN